jgi:putative FmdB family regulatory protein
MPKYDYECENCKHKLIDVYQSFDSESLTKCEKCGQNSLNKVIYCPYISIKGEVKTVGQLAESNSKKMGKALVEEKTLKDKEEKKQALKDAKKEMRSKINKMSSEQTRRYIEDGKI